MTLAAESKKVGKEPFTIVECLLDRCNLKYNSTATNYLLYSADFSNAAWVKTGVTVTADATLSPRHMAAVNADKLTCDNTGDDQIFQNVTVVSSSYKYFFSVYLKNVDCTDSLIVLTLSGGTVRQAYFKITWATMAISGISGAVTDSGVEYIVDGWYRVWIATTDNSTGNNSAQCRIDPQDSGSTTRSLYAFGAQLERNVSVLGHLSGTTSVSTTKTCSAALSPGNECYNTRETCQVYTEYSSMMREYRWCESRANMPRLDNLVYGTPLIPCLVKAPDFTATKLTPGKGISTRGTISFQLQDFPHHDRGVDPYAATRSYVASIMARGTYFGRLFARNRHYAGRIVRVYSGYIGATFSWADMQMRTYILDQFEGPDDKGIAHGTGKDILRLAEDDKTQVPVASTGKLTANITNVATTFSCTASLGATYAASGTLKIGSELMTFTRATDTFTVVRATNGTTAAAHNSGEVIQQCLVFSSVNIVNIFNTLLVTYAGVPARFIPFNDNPANPDEWDTEKTDWFGGMNLTNIIHTPTGMRQLMDDLCRVGMANMWWDDVAAKIKLKAIVPPKSNAALTVLDDTSNFIENSFKLKIDENSRRSQIWVIYDKADLVEDNAAKNYRRTYVQADLNSEAESAYNKTQIETITSNWFGASDDNKAAQLAGRLLSRYTNPPKMIEFSMSAKDYLVSAGDLVEITTDNIQDASGLSVATRFEIIEKREVKQGEVFSYKALESSYSGRYGFIGPNTLSNYTAETSANKQAYAFIADSSGLMSNGDQGYKII